MKKNAAFILIFLFSFLIIIKENTNAQTNYPYYGIWQAFGTEIYGNTDIHGRLISFNWSDIQPNSTQFVWDINSTTNLFDDAIKTRTKSSATGVPGDVPIMISIFVYNQGATVGASVGAPSWLFNAPLNIPVVGLDLNNDNIADINTPYYFAKDYQDKFQAMVAAVKNHILNAINSTGSTQSEIDLKNACKKIVAVQACFGSTGDFISYKGSPIYPAANTLCTIRREDGTIVTNFDAHTKIQNIPPSGNNAGGFTELFHIFTKYYQDAYYSNGNAIVGSPGIRVIHNPDNQEVTNDNWLGNPTHTTSPNNNCPGTWRKTGLLGHIYQSNNEWDLSHGSDDLSWWKSTLSDPYTTDYIRGRCELVGDITNTNWWNGLYTANNSCGTPVTRSTTFTGYQYKNLFTLYAYMLYFGDDWTNPTQQILDNTSSNYAYYQPALQFFNKYAGQKDPSTATNGFCLLRDGLDANDVARFDASYGIISQSNAQRYISIVNGFTSHGAVLEDPCAASGGSSDNRTALGINDVGWNTIRGNYERYLTQAQVDINGDGIKDPLYATNDCYWNVTAANDPNSVFGRYAKSIRNQTTSATGTGLYFVIVDNFLQNYTGNIKITCWYLDKGSDFWQLQYKDLNNVAQKIRVDKTNTLTWKSASFVLNANIFKNRNASASASDFFLSTYNAGSNLPEEDIFSLIEIEKIGSGPLKTKGNIGTHTLQSISTLNISPNPASDHFTISLASKKQIASISIFSESGRMVMNKKMNAQNISVSKKEIGSLPGIYYVTVIDNNNQKHSGILKLTE